MTDKPCPFCGRIERGEHDAGRHSAVVWFAPLDPVVPGHMLFLPSMHVEHGQMRGPAAVADAMEAAAHYARHHQSRYPSWNLITSFGSAATQTVPHLHVHLVPRAAGDALPLPWTPQQEAARLAAQEACS